MDSRSVVRRTHTHDRGALTPPELRSRRSTEPNTRRKLPPKAPTTHLIGDNINEGERICKRYFRARISPSGPDQDKRKGHTGCPATEVAPAEENPRKLLTVQALKSTVKDSRIFHRVYKTF